MTFLSFSLAFCLLVVLHVILNSKFKLCAFVLSMLLIKGGIEKSNGQYLGLIYDEKLTYLGLNLNSGNFGGFTLLYVSCGETCLLVL
jgi:hypothetical protein